MSAPIRTLSLAALSAASLSLSLAPSTAAAQAAATAAPERVEAAPTMIQIGKGLGTAIRLPRPAKNVFIANPVVADVSAVSNQLVYVFGKQDGETTVYAVDNADRVIYSATVRIGNNVAQLRDMLKLALPTATITVDTLNGMILLSGFVAGPQDMEEAGRLAQSFVGPGQLVVNKLQTRTPVQVHLKVRFAEVSREIVKSIGANWQMNDTTGGFQFGLLRGRDFLQDAVTVTEPLFNPVTGIPVIDPATSLPVIVTRILQPETELFPSDASTALRFQQRLFGVNTDGVLDALETEGLLTVLAEPTLTALSGQSANFLAGGEFPIPVAIEDQQISIEFKEYGVKLEFTPVVHSGNRISVKVKPEVSQITETGAVRLNGISIPALLTRRAETLVELGSGESFVIGGLLQNTVASDVSKLPGIGNLPILGALFRSDRFRRSETELVIVVTPYLVRPMQPGEVRLPTDGFQATNDFERYLLGQTFRAGYRPAPAPGVATPANAARPAAGVSPGFTFTP